MPRASIVIPIKDEEANLAGLYTDLSQALEDDSWEAIFVDDGSKDGSFAQLSQIANSDPRIKIIRMRRNFGQSAAMQAGIDHATGEVIVTMDGDRQNDPADIPMMLDKLEAEQLDAVLGERIERQDKLLVRRLPSLAANWLIRQVTGCPFRDFGCTMRVMRNDLARSLRIYGEMHRFISVLAQQQGARLAQIPVRHHPRTAGQSKYNLSRTFRVILDLITVTFLNRYLTRPLHFFGGGALVFMAIGLIIFLVTLGMKVVVGVDMTGNPLLLLSVLLELMGFQCISVGLLGEMMTRTYFESQGKAHYLIREAINLPDLAAAPIRLPLVG